ncbi:MAG: hypothetical protein PUE66_08105 [Erysipelotrichaceae bacterium]|nr:hypothetical protein [Erysipelotrichaceae bacterium]
MNNGKSWCYLMLYVPDEIQYVDRMSVSATVCNKYNDININTYDINKTNNVLLTKCEDKMDGKTIIETNFSVKDIYDGKVDFNNSNDSVVTANDKDSLEANVKDVIR